jgi:hypothetical protein
MQDGPWWVFHHQWVREDLYWSGKTSRQHHLVLQAKTGEQMAVDIGGSIGPRLEVYFTQADLHDDFVEIAFVWK